MDPSRLRIVAPVARPEQVSILAGAGASELYCGALPDDWAELFGDADLANRRQGRAANARSVEELAGIVHGAIRTGLPVYLVLNARYTEVQESRILDLVYDFDQAGGTGIITGDLGILLELRRVGSRLVRHFSLTVPLQNSSAVAMAVELGVTRVCLPRSVRLRDIEAIARKHAGIGLEAVAMFQNCLFEDGLCGFYHGVRIPAGVPARFDYERQQPGLAPVAWSYDPDYSGHGCMLDWKTASGPVSGTDRCDDPAPACAACSLRSLAEAGVGFLKVAGRGYPTEKLAAAVGFLRATVPLVGQGAGVESAASARKLYRESFGVDCDGRHCYYPDSMLRE